MGAEIKCPELKLHSKSIDNLIKLQKMVDKLPINGSQLAIAKSANKAIKNLPVTGSDLAMAKQANEITKHTNSIVKNIRNVNSVVNDISISHPIPKGLVYSSNSEGMGKIGSLIKEQAKESLALSADISSLNRLLIDNLEESLNPVDIADSIFKLSTDDLKHFTDKSLEEYILNHHLKDYKSFKEFKLSDEVIEAYEEIQKKYKLVQVLKKQIDFVLNQIKKRLRNLREFFTKTHSFHFKNLDDYRPSTLIGVVR